MSEVPSKRDQQREERRQEILRAALEVFGQKGFHASKVSDVAAKAGVSQGTIYWYFESKEDLITAALLSVIEQFGEESFEALSLCNTAAEKLYALGAASGEMLDQFAGAFTLFLEYWASSSRREESAQLWIDVLVQYKEVVQEIVEDGVRAGEFRPVDTEALVWSLLAALDGLAAYTMFVPGVDLSATTSVLVETLLGGLLVERPE